MNIIEHINAGHYPNDEKGRALVPMRSGDTVTVYATDAPGEEPIVGHTGNDVGMWRPDGSYTNYECNLDLLPPPPRKVEVKAYMTLATWDGRPYVQLGVYKERPKETAGHAVVELTGSYEEPWS